MKNNWTCAYDGTKKKLKDGRCAACGRSSAEEAKLDAKEWDKESLMLPWVQGDDTPGDDQGDNACNLYDEDSGGNLIAECINPETATFINRAVNCHEEWRHAMFQAIAAIRNPVDWQSCDTGQTGVKCPGIKCFMGEHRAACILEQAIARAEAK